MIGSAALHSDSDTDNELFNEVHKMLFKAKSKEQFIEMKQKLRPLYYAYAKES